LGETLVTEITLFQFENKPLHVDVWASGELMFSAPDVCRALGLSDVTSSLRVLDEDEKGPLTVQTLGGTQEVNGITEPGLYKLISRSRKPEAKRFDRWVRHEVLPQIRKTGSYSAAPAIDLNDPAFLRQTLIGYTEKVIALEAEKAVLAPKAESFDELANQNGRHNLRSAAQQSGWPEKLFIARAVTEGWLYIHSLTGKKLAYADKIKAGLMDVKNVSIKRSSGFSENVGQPLFTQKGLLKFRELIGPYHPPRAVEAA